MIKASEKKTNPKFSAILGIVVGLIFVVALVVIYRDVLTGNAVNINDLLENNTLEKDKYVEMHIDGVIGNYAETKHTVNFIPVGTDQHYIIWLDNDQFISLATQDKNLMKRLDEITTATWDYNDGVIDELPEAVVVRGIVHSMDPEIRGYIDQWANEIGISDSIIYLSVDNTETPTKAWLEILLFLAISVASTIALISIIKKEKEQEMIYSFSGKATVTSTSDEEDL